VPEEIQNGSQFAIVLRSISSFIKRNGNSHFDIESLKLDITKTLNFFSLLSMYVNIEEIEDEMQEVFFNFLQGANNPNVKLYANYIWLASALNVLNHMYKQVERYIIGKQYRNAFQINSNSFYEFLRETVDKVHGFVVDQFKINDLDPSICIGISQLHVLKTLGGKSFAV
jgi:hypothetical protein